MPTFSPMIVVFAILIAAALLILWQIPKRQTAQAAIAKGLSPAIE